MLEIVPTCWYYFTKSVSACVCVCMCAHVSVVFGWLEAKVSQKSSTRHLYRRLQFPFNIDSLATLLDLQHQCKWLMS